MWLFWKVSCSFFALLECSPGRSSVLLIFLSCTSTVFVTETWQGSGLCCRHLQMTKVHQRREVCFSKVTYCLNPENPMMYTLQNFCWHDIVCCCVINLYVYLGLIVGSTPFRESREDRGGSSEITARIGPKTSSPLPCASLLLSNRDRSTEELGMGDIALAIGIPLRMLNGTKTARTFTLHQITITLRCWKPKVTVFSLRTMALFRF